MNYRKKRHRSYFRKFARPFIAIRRSLADALALQILLLSMIAAGSAMSAAADGSVAPANGGKVVNENEPCSAAHFPAGFTERTLACAQVL